MPLDAVTLQYVEDALSECFGTMGYHAVLDNFVLRAGVPKRFVDQARSGAEAKAQSTRWGAGKAPKRFVVQELLNILANLGDEGDRATVGLVNNLVKGQFPDATPKARQAIDFLKEQIDTDKKTKEQAREQERHRREDEARKLETEKEALFVRKQQGKDALRGRFEALISETEFQKRGYLFEGFLNDFFEHEGLKPHSPYRVVGEQIDGSFAFRSQTHLVEAKWTEKSVAAREFSSLMYKIEGKTADTRGLFVSVNGYSQDALTSLIGKGALRFVCIDGAHIFRCFEVGQSLQKVLETVWRHADETGEPYFTVGRFR